MSRARMPRARQRLCLRPRMVPGRLYNRQTNGGNQMPLVVSDKSKADRIDVRAEGKWWTRLAGTGTIYPTAGLGYRDVCQGQMGNCWFLCAPLAIALKQQGADFLQNRLLDNGDEWVFCELW